MDSLPSLGYSRLRNDESIDEEKEERLFQRFRGLLRLRRIGIIRPPRVKVRGLRRLRFLRRRSSFFSRIRVPWRKALRRMKNGQVHLNDLFAGNFLVMQANPNPSTCKERSFMGHRGFAPPPIGRIA